MKKPVSFFKKQIMAATVLLFLFAACFEFDYVNQPGSVDPNSSFTVNVSITTTDGGGTEEYTPYFGIKLPEGWTVEDNVPFANNTVTGVFVYSASVSAEMENLDPADPGYYWWVGAGADPVIYNYEDTYLIDPLIHTDDQTGTFYLDYMGGSNSQGYGGLNYARNNDNIVTVGLPDEVVVTSSSDSGPGSLREAIENVDFYGTITFDLQDGNSVFLENELNLYKDITISGSEDEPVILSGEGVTRVFYIGQFREPVLEHLIITNGFFNSGGGIYCDSYSAPTFSHLTVANCYSTSHGGGIYMYYANPILNNVTIRHNDASSNGGGMYINNNSSPLLSQVVIRNNTASNGAGMYVRNGSNPGLEKVTIRENSATNYGGAIYCQYNAFPAFDSINRSSIYLNNALWGNDIFSDAVMNVVVDTFTVMMPDEFFTYPLYNFSFDILYGMIEQVNADLYVSPNGDNTNSGLNAEEPLKTISYALLKLQASETDPHTIHLLEGTYSPSTNGESFPLFMRSNITLAGSDEMNVILNAEGQSKVLNFFEVQNCEARNMTLTGGYDANGGAIACQYSSPALKNLVITGNTATQYGGGIYLYDGCYPELANVTITNNTANQRGGGIYSNYYNNITFSTTDRCNIYLNSAGYGGDLYADGNMMSVIVDTFTVLVPNQYHAYPLYNFEFDILNGKVEQVTADLFVSPQGDNTNSGLTAGEPLRNINFAFSKMIPDPDNPVIVHLLEGIYSPSANNETFPLLMNNFVSLQGVGPDEVVLDAEGLTNVVVFESVDSCTLSDLTIKGGNESYYGNGGGVYCYASSPTLHNLVVRENHSSYSGGGLYCYNSSSPTISEVVITENTASNYGGGIFSTYYSSPQIEDCQINNNTAYYGGGIFMEDGNPILSNTTIEGNTAEYNAGGIYCGWNTNPELKNVTVKYNTAEYGGGFLFDNYLQPTFDSIERCNIYMNSADYGSDLYSYNNGIQINVVVDTFTVMFPKFYHAYPLSNFNFDILHGIIPQVAADLYVSPEGDNSNSGITPEEPLKTIRHALIIIAEDSLNLFTIHLDEGTYSPSTNGEEFPLTMAEYVYLSGPGEGEAILDAELTNRVITITDIVDIKLSNLTIQGGNIYDGAGIYCNNASPLLENLVIRDNHATDDGGGIFCYNNSSPVMQNISLTNNTSQSTGGGIYISNNCNPVIENTQLSYNSGYYGGGLYAANSIIELTNVEFSGNEANYSGGGIHGESSNITLKNVTIKENEAETGGGIYNAYSSSILFDDSERSNIYFNYAITGKEIYSTELMDVVVDTFTVLYPTEFFVYPLENFTFDILNYKFEQVNADLYVSPDGDDENGGLSSDDPLKTIYAAFARIVADSLNQNTIYLMEGLYGPSYNGENFPVNLLDWVSITGLSQQQVILHGDDQSGIMILNGNQGNSISHLTFAHGNADEGGGLRCYDSDPVLTNLTFTSNKANYAGGGICLQGSNPEMTNINFLKNKADYGGGLYVYNSSSPTLQQALFKMNKAYSGGAMYFEYGTDITLSHIKVENNQASLGGGVSMYGNSAHIEHGSIINNNAELGGGIFMNGNADINLKDVDIFGNSAEDYGGGIYSEGSSTVTFDTLDRSNIFMNAATLANDLFSESFMNVVVDTFTVLYPTKFYASPLSNYSFDILHGMVTQVDDDLYVSPEGNNANSGLTAAAPLKTIYYANSKILAGSTNPHSIHLLPGTYSDSINGEHFPIMAMDFVTLAGSGQDEVILDGEGERRVLDIISSEGVAITDLTITGGYGSNGAGIYIYQSSPQLIELTVHNNASYYNGGGIYMGDQSNAFMEDVEIYNNTADNGAGMYIYDDSEPVLQDVRIENNQASYSGGGIFFSNHSHADLNSVIITSNQANYGGGVYLSNSNPALHYVTLENNTASSYGGGVYVNDNSSPDMAHVVIRENMAGSGGGIYIDYAEPSLSRVTVTGNTATWNGGGIFSGNSSVLSLDSVNRSSIYMNYCYSGQGSDIFYDNYYYYNPPQMLNVVVDTFTVMVPKNHQASPLTSFTFDINFGLIPQEELELYVSPDGDDTNTGQGPDDPLKTINHAVSILGADSINLYDVMLMDGIYSPATNGEVYPLQMDDHMSLSGIPGSDVILDAEGTAGVLNIQDRRGVEISNLTIQGGLKNDGGGIYCTYSDPVLTNLFITNNTATDDGGGISCFNNSSPVMQHVMLTNNTSQSAGGGVFVSNSTISLQQSVVKWNYAEQDGGGLYLDESQLTLSGSSIAENIAGDDGGGIYSGYNAEVFFDSLQRPSIYLNDAVRGYDLYTQDAMDVIVDTFTVQYPKSQHAYPLQNYTFDILHGLIPQVQADLYVSPAGDDGNSGLTPEEPLKTINYALSIVAEDSVNLYTVNLLEGVYGPSASGEQFPIFAVDYVNIKGVSADLVTLDGEGLSTVISVEYCMNAKISDLTIIGGNAYEGGGIHCNHSNPVIENIHFTGNNSTHGGGIHIRNYSSPEIREVTFMNNTADNGGAIFITGYSDPLLKDLRVEANSAEDGGGIYCTVQASPTLDNVLLYGNNASEDGGGMYCMNNSMPHLKNVKVIENTSLNEGGGIWCNQNSIVVFDTANRSTIYLNAAMTGNELYSDNSMLVVVDTFTVMYPKSYHASPLNNFEFDILTGLIPQVSADLYVSPEGDNTNSGLTADDPLKTIHFATSIITEDSLNMYTIHLANGIYSPSTNGEFYPVYIPEYVGIEGEDMDETILDAEQTNRVIAFYYSSEAAVKNMTIKGGNFPDGFGGGIYMEFSTASFSNIKVLENYAKYGGGIFLKNSSPAMTNITVMNNSSFYGGGGICTYDNSNPIIESSMIWDNEASTYGGGMYCSASSSPVLKDISFKYNKASTGAGLYCSNNSNPMLDEVTIVNNEAEHSGGGIYAPYANLSINRSNISDNTCNGKGGGIYLSNFSTSVENSRISGNSAVDGGGIYISASEPRIVNCAITLNEASQNGGGIYLSVSDASLVNLTLGDNSGGEGSGIYAYRSNIEATNSILWNEELNEVVFRATGSPSSISISYSDLQGSEDGIITNGNATVTWDESNIGDDPQFDLGSATPYMLTSGSPCIDAGNPDTTGLLLPYCDLLGNVRVWDGDYDGLAVIDMGAYEFDAITGMDQLWGQRSGITIQSYPNPFSDIVTFTFESRKTLNISMEIRDLSGNKVMDLEDGRAISGKETINFNLGGLNKGVYFVRIIAGNQQITKKIVKIR